MHLRQGEHPRFKLPGETVDHIIDDLALHVPALRACSLTCSKWRVRSQYHLLSSIYIADTTHVASLSSFVAMFPFRAEGIRRVRISISALCGDVVLQLLPLANADTLTLSSASSTTLDELRLARLPIIFPNISSFTIEDCPLQLDMRSFMRTLSGFALLRTLDLLQGPTVSRSGYPIAVDHVPPRNALLSLENLALNVNNRIICLCFDDDSWFDAAALHRLELEGPDRLIDSRYPDLLVQTRPTLQELVLCVESAASPTLQMSPQTFPPAPNLKTLRMSFRETNINPIALEPILRRFGRPFAYPARTAVTVDVFTAAPDTLPESDWENGWSIVAEEHARRPVWCASLTFVVPKLIADEYQEAFTKIEQMLRACDVTIRALL